MLRGTAATFDSLARLDAVAFPDSVKAFCYVKNVQDFKNVKKNSPKVKGRESVQSVLVCGAVVFYSMAARVGGLPSGLTSFIAD